MRPESDPRHVEPRLAELATCAPQRLHADTDELYLVKWYCEPPSMTEEFTSRHETWDLRWSLAIRRVYAWERPVGPDVVGLFPAALTALVMPVPARTAEVRCRYVEPVLRAAMQGMLKGEFLNKMAGTMARRLSMADMRSLAGRYLGE